MLWPESEENGNSYLNASMLPPSESESENESEPGSAEEPPG